MSARGTVFRRCRRDCSPDCRQHKWSYAVELPRVGGKRQQATRGGYHTREEAQNALDDLRDQVRKGTLAPDRKITVKQYMNEWLARKVEVGKIRPSTAASYRQHIDDYIVPTIGAVRMSQLRAHHVEAVLAKAREGARDKKLPKARKRGRSKATGKATSPATVQRVHATVRSAFNTAVKRGELPHNPCAHVELESATRPEVNPWTPHECGKFLAWLEAEGHPLHALFMLAVTRGCAAVRCAR